MSTVKRPEVQTPIQAAPIPDSAPAFDQLIGLARKYQYSGEEDFDSARTRAMRERPDLVRQLPADSWLRRYLDVKRGPDAGSQRQEVGASAAEPTCFRCARPCTTDSVVQAGLRWHSTCWNAATDPAKIAAVEKSERARDAGAAELITQYIDDERDRHPSLDDPRALEFVITKYDLAERWRTIQIKELSSRLVRAEVGRRVATYCRDYGLDPAKDIRRATASVLDAAPELKAAYAKS